MEELIYFLLMSSKWTLFYQMFWESTHFSWKFIILKYMMCPFQFFSNAALDF